LADLKVLAVNTPQVAVCEKDRPRPSPAGYGGFFAEMEADVRHWDFVGGSTEAGLAVGTVDPATTGTDVTGGQAFFQS
jgi:hypothetical protein